MIPDAIYNYDEILKYNACEKIQIKLNINEAFHSTLIAHIHTIHQSYATTHKSRRSYGK